MVANRASVVRCNLLSDPRVLSAQLYAHLGFRHGCVVKLCAIRGPVDTRWYEPFGHWGPLAPAGMANFALVSYPVLRRGLPQPCLRQRSNLYGQTVEMMIFHYLLI